MASTITSLDTVRAPRTYVRYRARLNRPGEEDITTAPDRDPKRALRNLIEALRDAKIITVEPLNVRRKQDVRFEEV